MTNNLIETDELILTVFYGGIDRGTSYQINTRNFETNEWEHIQVTGPQMYQLLTCFMTHMTAKMRAIERALKQGK